MNKNKNSFQLKKKRATESQQNNESLNGKQQRAKKISMKAKRQTANTYTHVLQDINERETANTHTHTHKRITRYQ